MSRLWSPICDQLGIETPIFGFAHDVATVAAISRAGGYGVYGATRRFPQEIRDELAEIRSLVGDKPFGVDLVLPPGMPEHNSREAIEAEIPQEHKDFVQSIIDRFDVPAATKPGMRTRFIRSSEIEAEQVEAVLDSSANMFACGIGAPSPVVEAAKERGKQRLHSSAVLIMFRDQSMRAWTLSWHRGTTLAHIQAPSAPSLWSPKSSRLREIFLFWLQAVSRLDNTLPQHLPWALRESGSEPLGYFQWSIRTTCTL